MLTHQRQPLLLEIVTVEIPVEEVVVGDIVVVDQAKTYQLIVAIVEGSTAFDQATYR